MGRRKILYGIIESLILAGVVYLVYFVMNPVPERFLTMNIHPLLIVTVMISLRYGNYLGLFSALVASAAYLFAYSQLGRDIYLMLIDYAQYKFLLMFFLGAVVFGRFKDNHDFRLATAVKRYDNLAVKYEELQDGYEKLKFIKEELRKRVVGSEQSIVSLYEIASSLETLDSEEIYTEIVGLLRRYIQAEAVSIYLVDRSERYLRLKIHAGHSEVVPTSIRIEDHPGLAPVFAHQQPVKMVQGETVHEGGPLMIAPVIHKDRVVALIQVDAMPFSQVTDYAFHLFKVIGDWVTKALVQALDVEEMKKSEQYFEGTAIVKYSRFLHRLEEEKSREKQFGLPHTVLRYPLQGRSAAEVDELLHGRIREIDVVTVMEPWIMLLLPATEAAQSETVRSRLDPVLLFGEDSHE